MICYISVSGVIDLGIEDQSSIPGGGSDVSVRCHVHTASESICVYTFGTVASVHGDKAVEV
jgi:hypothetical protein